MSQRFDDWEGDFLAHHGTLGMKWHRRRYQNEDGSLTPLGRVHYGIGEGRAKGAVREGRYVAKQFKKESKKLGKLSEQADRGLQMRKGEKYDHKSNVQIAKATVMGTLAGGAYGIQKKSWAQSGLDKKLAYAFDSDMQRINNVGKYATAAAGGLAVYHLGKSAVYSVMAHNAKKRASDIGHEKAMQKYRQQVDRMITMFGDTSYGDIVRSLRQTSQQPAQKPAVRKQTGGGQSSQRNSRGLKPNQAALEDAWATASKKYEQARNERARHATDIGGKRYKAMKEAQKEMGDAAERFFNSMSEAERKRYHDRYLS